MFREYMHLEKFGNEGVEGIELGKVYVFPKIDGTNASVWLDLGPDGSGVFCAGSRKRQLSTHSDNAGFYNWAVESSKVATFLNENPQLRLYGEWLVPHSFQGYRPDAWKKFYIFDVFNDETQQYMSYEAYQPLMEKYELDYIPPLAIVNNGEYTRFLHYLDTNLFLCPDGGEPGEGVALKNYDYYNKFNNQVWAKIVRQEFKELHAKAMGAPEVNESKMNEERILEIALTDALIEKTFAKIKTEKDGWKSQYIPELFGRLFHDIVVEELWDCLKEINHGSVNFKTLKALMINQIKQKRKDLF